MRLLTTVALTCLILVISAVARENLVVAIRLGKPFVFEEKGILSGFSIDLWNEIAKQINIKTEFIVKPAVKDLLASVNNHEAALQHLGLWEQSHASPERDPPAKQITFDPSYSQLI